MGAACAIGGSVVIGVGAATWLVAEIGALDSRPLLKLWASSVGARGEVGPAKLFGVPVSPADDDPSADSGWGKGKGDFKPEVGADGIGGAGGL